MYLINPQKVYRFGPRRRKIRGIVVKDLLSELRKSGFNPSFLDEYYRLGVISRAEYREISRRAEPEVRKLQQQLNFDYVFSVLRKLARPKGGKLTAKSAAFLKEIGPRLLHLYRTRQILQSHYRILLREYKRLAKKIRVIVPARAEVAQKLRFKDLETWLLPKLQEDEYIYTSDFLLLEFLSVKKDWDLFLKKYYIEIRLHDALLAESFIKYYPPSLFEPCRKIFEGLKKTYKEPIRLGPMAPFWLRLSMLNDEYHPLYTLLGYGRRASLPEILNKRNRRQKIFHVFGLFRWVGPSSIKQLNLETGELVIWGFRWLYKKGKLPLDYIQKSYEPVNLSKKTSDGGYRKTPQIEDVFLSRFIGSKKLRPVKFLGLYIPVERH
jgi:hypothetical protein